MISPHGIQTSYFSTCLKRAIQMGFLFIFSVVRDLSLYNISWRDHSISSREEKLDISTSSKMSNLFHSFLISTLFAALITICIYISFNVSQFHTSYLVYKGLAFLESALLLKQTKICEFEHGPMFQNHAGEAVRLIYEVRLQPLNGLETV